MPCTSNNDRVVFVPEFRACVKVVFHRAPPCHPEMHVSFTHGSDAVLHRCGMHNGMSRALQLMLVPIDGPVALVRETHPELRVSSSCSPCGPSPVQQLGLMSGRELAAANQPGPAQVVALHRNSSNTATVQSRVAHGHILRQADADSKVQPVIPPPI